MLTPFPKAIDILSNHGVPTEKSQHPTAIGDRLGDTYSPGREIVLPRGEVKVGVGALPQESEVR